tara:strand:- start:1765 stop:2487 length:723 start_codon:yes stop_codon:yes gene_type:complete
MINNINPMLGATVSINEESTTSLDLPDKIQSILNMGNEQPMTTPVQSYQEGGMVQRAGVQTIPQQSKLMDSNRMDTEINQMITQNPEVAGRIKVAIEAGLQSGEITMEDLNMAIQLAKTVVQNPNLYPQIRQFAIQKGLATEEELPLDYDEGLVIALLTAAKSLSTNMQPSNQPMQDMQEGGVLKGPPHEDGGIPVNVAGVNSAEMEGGEYVIPKNVVMAKGTDFFDKMLASYEDKPDAT